MACLRSSPSISGRWFYADTCKPLPSFVKAVCYSISWMLHILFHESPTDGPLSRFCSFANINSELLCLRIFAWEQVEFPAQTEIHLKFGWVFANCPPLERPQFMFLPRVHGTHIPSTLGISILLDCCLAEKQKYYYYKVHLFIYRLNWHLLISEEGWITFFLFSYV